jgi:sortase (surface protein transpeptidase)
VATREDPVEPGDRNYVGPDTDQAGSVAVDGRPAPRLGKGVVIVRSIGELLITAGLVVLLFVVYELYVTDLFSAAKQADASSALDNQWAKDRQLHPELIDGQAFARMYIPAFGADYHFTIQEGTDENSLAIGPGHYKGTALPGQPGNFGVAGHRVGKGAPFNDLDQLNSCDSIIIENQTDFFVYKVLPHDEEIAGWAAGKGKTPQCAGVSTLRDPNQPQGGVYSLTSGRKIVLPSEGDAVNPVPYQPAGILPTASQIALLTLTTCNPQFSDKQRLIITSVLVRQVPKSQVKGYADLLSRIGEDS